MSNKLNAENSIVTIIIEMTYKEDVQIIKEFIKEESGTFTVSKVNRFEFFLNEDQQKATIIETFEDGDIFDEIAEKLLTTENKPYITIPDAMKKIDDLRADENNDKKFLNDYDLFIQDLESQHKNNL